MTLADFPDDPLGLMPGELPPRPRVWMNAADLQRCRNFAREYPWAGQAYGNVVNKARLTRLPDNADACLPQASADGQALLNLAIAAALEENEVWAAQVIAHLHRIAQRYPTWPQQPDGARIGDHLHGEKMWARDAAAAYDLCVDLAGASGAVQEEIATGLLRPAIEEVVWHPVHMMCDNHHTTALLATLAVGGALDEPRYLHSAFYGHTHRDGRRFAGIAHQLMHDFLNDGLQWERCIGYQFYTLYCVKRMAWIAQRLGIDLWHRPWPATTAPSNDGENHRDFDASGDKTLKDYFLAPLYLAHSDLSTARMGDSSVAYIHHLDPWYTLYEPAWAEYGDERFAWILTQQYEMMRRRSGLEYAPRGCGDQNFIFVERADLPPGAFDLTRDTTFCLTGRHENGRTLFPSAGFAVLRASDNPSAHNVTFTYGPHHAGHQHPDLLSFVWQVDGTTALTDTGCTTYEDELHGIWYCQTVAHNTVLMDGISQRPQGDSAELWMTDPSENPARGQLLAFASRPEVKIVAAETRNAYDTPVILRRTLLVTQDYVLDRFQCSGEQHRWDYALHPASAVETSLELQHRAGVLGAAHGMREVCNLHDAVLPTNGTQLSWGNCAAWVWGSTPARLSIGANPATAGGSNTTLVLTQVGENIEYCSVFHRRSRQLQITMESGRVQITTERFTDVIPCSAEAVLWQRRKRDGSVIEELVPI